MSHLIAEHSIPNVKTQNYPSWFGLSTIRKIWSFHVSCSAKNGNETGTVEYSTELAFNSSLPNLIVLNIAFYMHLIWFGACKMRRLNQPSIFWAFYFFFFQYIYGLKISKVLACTFDFSFFWYNFNFSALRALFNCTDQSSIAQVNNIYDTYERQFSDGSWNTFLTGIRNDFPSFFDSLV